MSSAEIGKTESEPWEAELRRVFRALRVVSAANKALTVASDVVAWLNQVCQTAVEAGGYRMAWVGFADFGEEKIVRPVAHAGFESGWVESVSISWKDEPRGQGPAGTAIRTGKYCILRDIPSNPAFDPWRKEIEKQGYESAIALPLGGMGRTFGVLAMYAEEADAFGPRELEILKELASDLAYGLFVVFKTGFQRQSTAEALEESQRKLKDTERITRIAQWDRDLTTNVLTCSDEFYRILGLEPQKRKFRLSEFLEMVHPDDRAAVRKVAEEAAEKLGRFEVDYRVVRPDGQVRYLHGEGETMRNGVNRPARIVGFVQDVTQQQLAKIALENANRSLEAKNIALKEVLANIEMERGKIGRRVTRNVEEMILPLFQSLKQGATRRQRRTIDQIENHLREIVSPFVDELARAVNSLTPAEIRVCTYIERGLAVKEIAELEHLSPETISAHRRNIRRKLHIANRKINLASYLREIHRHPLAHALKHIG
jgi:PAS domain S-box-containing protein